MKVTILWGALEHYDYENYFPLRCLRAVAKKLAVFCDVLSVVTVMPRILAEMRQHLQQFTVLFAICKYEGITFLRKVVSTYEITGTFLLSDSSIRGVIQYSAADFHLDMPI